MNQPRHSYNVNRLLLHFCTAVLILSFFTLYISKERIYVFAGAYPDNYMVNAVALIGIVWVLNKFDHIIFTSDCRLPETVLQLVVSVVLTAFSVLGVYYEGQSSAATPLPDILHNKLAAFSFFMACCGGLLFFTVIFRLIHGLAGTAGTIKSVNAPLLDRFFGRKIYRNCIAVMVLCWLPLYILRFPGILHYDSWRSIAMYLGYIEYTTQHPLVWGVPIGILTKLGMRIGVNWLAAPVLCFIQHVLIMLLTPYTISTFRKHGMPNIILACTLAFFVLNPYISLYATVAYNDNIYSYALLLFSVEMLNYLFDRENYFKSLRCLSLTALAVFGTIFRYNGFYIMLVMFGIVSLREGWMLVKNRKRLKQAIVIVLIMVVSLLSGQLVQRTLNSIYNVRSISTRAMLAMPIQQTARCLGDLGAEIPKEDYDALHAVMTWTDEKYAEEFDPKTFDTVKRSFKTDATKEELLRFIKSWGRLVLMYPGKCIDTTIHQTYYLFSPLSDNARFYQSLETHATQLQEGNSVFNSMDFIIQIPALEGPCTLLAQFYDRMFPAIPLLGLLASQSAYSIILLGICVCTLFKSDRRPLLIALPLILTLGMTFIGPMIANHPRYTFPLVYCMPVLLVSFMKCGCKESSKP